MNNKAFVNLDPRYGGSSLIIVIHTKKRFIVIVDKFFLI